MKNSAFLEVLLGFNAFSTIEQVSKRIPILGKLKYFFIPFLAVRSLKEMTRTGREELQRRISRKRTTEDLDFFEHIAPTDGIIPTDPKEFRHLQMVASQLLFAGFEPISSWYYSTLLYLLKEPEILKTLASEIRDEFTSYNDIKPDALVSIEYLNACLHESLRLFPSNNMGLPRVSPGAVIDGTYVPPGVCFFLHTFSCEILPLSPFAVCDLSGHFPHCASRLIVNQ